MQHQHVLVGRMYGAILAARAVVGPRSRKLHAVLFRIMRILSCYSMHSLVMPESAREFVRETWRGAPWGCSEL